MPKTTAKPLPATATAHTRMCSRCHNAPPRAPGQTYCKTCAARHQRDRYRLKISPNAARNAATLLRRQRPHAGIKSFTEIAQALDLSKGTVFSAYKSALAKLTKNPANFSLLLEWIHACEATTHPPLQARSLECQKNWTSLHGEQKETHPRPKTNRRAERAKG